MAMASERKNDSTFITYISGLIMQRIEESKGNMSHNKSKTKNNFLVRIKTTFSISNSFQKVATIRATDMDMDMDTTDTFVLYNNPSH